MTQLQVDSPAKAIGFRGSLASGKPSPAVLGQHASWPGLQSRDARKMLPNKIWP